MFGWTADEATSHRLLDAFVDGGFNAVDTADVYSAWVPGHAGGESERVIGRWLKARGRRDDVLILTKVAMWPAQPGLSAANIAAAVEGSLKRLQTDYIDLYQAHQDDAATPIEETLEAFDRLVKAGKVRAIGASNFSPERLSASLKTSQALGLARYETIQPKFNLHDRDEVEGPLAELAAREGLGIIPYYGLAAGFLTGKYRTEADLEGRSRGRTVKQYLTARGLKILAALDAAAETVGASQAQVALAWIMAHPAITAPLASATSVEQLNELMGAARLTLPTEVIAALNAAG
ncbi:aryl-alcohol dehydrogenase-like predicted oxidoreductase [Caulobacter sp. BE254]|nr:aryl-alcohol dehydrogenase-like predicted oxidoreductase [Caulobacter sp. BE254]